MKFTYASGQKPLEGYTIKRGIGRGGFGEVYFGVSDRGKEVAMKLVQANHDVELRGIQQCLNLKHPNLVHLYDLRIDAEGDHWLIMEYVAGEPLSAILARHPGGVAPELAVQWFQGIAAAVHHLHDHGVVHRDLKPGNIFLENGFIKVGDYGLCKSMGGSQQLRQTQSVGTVHYMAPEIATGNYRHQVDVYAAGVILYEMLTGQVPFDGESVVEILFKHQTERPDLSKVPAAFVPVLDRALSKNPALRFQSLSEMSRQVAATVSSRPQPAEPLRIPPPLEPALRQQYEAPTQLLARPYQRLAVVSGTLLLATLLAAASAFALAVLGEADWMVFTRVFFLTTLGSAMVLISAPLWPGPIEESWPRRLTFMGLGLLIGVAAVWLDGFQLPLPWSGGASADSLHPLPVGESQARHRFFGLLYRDNSSLPVLAGYLSYFGLMFLTLRWWKIGEQNRRRRFTLRAVFAVGFWAFILLFLLPAAPQRQEGFWVLVLTATIVQIASPWAPRGPERSKKLRWRCA